MVSSDCAAEGIAAVDVDVLFKRLEEHGVGVGRGRGRPPVAAVCMKDLRLKICVLGEKVFVLVVIESGVVDAGQCKSFAQDLRPVGKMQVVVFQEINDRVVSKILFVDMLEHMEEGSAFRPCFELDDRIAALFAQEML